MMDSPELIILDVGHGNCALLRDTNAVTVIDCPPSTILIELLDRLDINIIDNILISHSDVDHVGGLPNLLRNVSVRNVFVNPDASKSGMNGSLWKGVRIALKLAEEDGTVIHPSLTSALSKKINSGQVEIEILSPSTTIALGGVGGDDLDGRKQTSNSMSVVVGLVHNFHRVALTPGDMDEVGLDNLLKKYQDIKAQILVFPHHGGKSSKTNLNQFARKLSNLVQPQLIVFSFDRNRYKNPQVDTIQGVRLASPEAHIMCTQLSQHCSLTNLSSDFSHLNSLPASGYQDNSCCGGTILVKINGDQTKYWPLFDDHRKFISDANIVATPICLY